MCLILQHMIHECCSLSDFVANAIKAGNQLKGIGSPKKETSFTHLHVQSVSIQRCNSLINYHTLCIVGETNQVVMIDSQNRSNMAAPLSFGPHWFNNMGLSLISEMLL